MSRPSTEIVRCLKEAGARSVWLCRDRAGAAYVLKTWPLGPVVLAKLLVGRSQPQRQQSGARRTAAAGIDTPAPRRGPRLVRRGTRLLVELTHDFAPGEDAFELARRGDLPRSRRRALGAACGRIVARYAAAGLMHRDLKLSNLVVAPDDGTVCVIDTVGVRRIADRGVATARMLERLDVQLREKGIDVGREVRTAALRAALRPLSPAGRRAAGRWLRAHPPR